MFVTYPDVPWWPGAPVLYEGGTATAGMRAHEQLNPSPLHGRNRACLYVAAEPPAIRSLTRVCAALRLVAQWYTTYVGITPVRRWRHAPSLASCSRTGVMFPNWCHALAWACVGCENGRGHGSPTMSHVIPLRLLQTLTLHRWNCNVLSSARKMTAGNYVRLLFGETLWRRRARWRPPHWWCAVRGA